MEKVITIIVTYNGMKWIKKCLESIRQSQHPSEVIIIDNGSTDETISFIKTNFPEVKLIESNENLGFGKANNVGFQYGIEQNADYFFLLNQDAYLFPDTIGNLIDNFKKNPEYGLISPIQLKNDLEIETIFVSYIKKYPNLQQRFSKEKSYKNEVLPIDFTNAALWMLSRKCVEKVGGFSPLFYHYGEDVDYSNRVRFHSFQNGVSCNAFGIHDRYVKPKESVATFNKRKQHPGPWQLRYHIILADPNKSWGTVLIQGGKLFLKSLIKHTIKGNWFSVKYDFIVITDVIKKLPYIKRLRKEVLGKKRHIFF